jgi:hypothetical protein
MVATHEAGAVHIDLNASLHVGYSLIVATKHGRGHVDGGAHNVKVSCVTLKRL